MFTAMVVLTLTTHSGVSLERVSRHVRLVVDEGPLVTAGYEGLTRAQLRVEYERIESLRPGIFLPIALLSVGAGGAALAMVVLMTGLNSFVGLSVVVAVTLAIGSVIGLGAAILGVILLVRSAPTRRTLGKQMDDIEAVTRDRRISPPEQPCPGQAPATYPWQVKAPASSITLAVF